MDVANAPEKPGSSTRIISLQDERYPPLLREIPDPPEKLYIRGDPSVLLQPQLAIVGSRRASAAALRLASLLAGQLTNAGFHICSGLALGIDGAAHRGALDAGGKSVAVMGAGLDHLYPKRHTRLAHQLATAGALVSELEPSMPPRKYNFPKRNRIISGLSMGVLVVEAAQASGSLITARLALEQGREVFALPWSTLHEGGRGCLRLIRDGAKMVLSVDDILEELGALYTLQSEVRPLCEPENTAADGSSKLLQFIGYEVVSLDELVHLSAQPPSKILAQLSSLELSGAILRTAGGYIRP